MDEEKGMDKKYQIFVSSTYRDLEEERRKVIEQILNLGHIPVGMELFQAGDETQWGYIQKRIVECDYYIVLVAERYGSEGPGGQSYTEMEYLFACDHRIPVAAFLLDESSRKLWPSEKVEFEKKEKVDAFRNLCQSKMCRFWKNGDDLSAKVVTSLWGLIESNPRVGWVRADSVASQEAIDEITTLSKERRDLQEELKKLKEKITSSEDITFTIEKMSSTRFNNKLMANDKSFFDKSILDLFMLIYGRLSLGLTQPVLDSYLRLLSGEEFLPNDFIQWLLEFLSANNLIDVVMSTGTQSRSIKTFLLSEHGKKIASWVPLQKSKNEKVSS
jgi:hypothetical protein